MIFLLGSERAINGYLIQIAISSQYIDAFLNLCLTVRD